MMTFTPLTREQFEDMPLSMVRRRQADMRRIVEALRLDHYGRYHAPLEARIADWATNRAALAEAVGCMELHCQGKALSGTGLCAQHLHKARSAA